MLKLKNIKKSFGGVKAIQGSSFIVPEKKVTALIGPNGAGKTTLFDIVSGLLKPDSGEVDFNKENITSKKIVSLDLEEALIALSISAATNPTAQLAMEKLKELQGCEVHMTHIPTPGDETGLRRLGVNITADPDFSSKWLFVG